MAMHNLLQKLSDELYNHIQTQQHLYQTDPSQSPSKAHVFLQHDLSVSTSFQAAILYRQCAHFQQHMCSVHAGLPMEPKQAHAQDAELAKAPASEVGSAATAQQVPLVCSHQDASEDPAKAPSTPTILRVNPPASSSTEPPVHLPPIMQNAQRLHQLLDTATSQLKGSYDMESPEHTSSVAAVLR